MLVFVRAPVDVVCHSRIKDASWLVGHDVDPVQPRHCFSPMDFDLLYVRPYGLLRLSLPAIPTPEVRLLVFPILRFKVRGLSDIFAASLNPVSSPFDDLTNRH